MIWKSLWDWILNFLLCCFVWLPCLWYAHFILRSRNIQVHVCSFCNSNTEGDIPHWSNLSLSPPSIKVMFHHTQAVVCCVPQSSSLAHSCSRSPPSPCAFSLGRRLSSSICLPMVWLGYPCNEQMVYYLFANVAPPAGSEMIKSCHEQDISSSNVIISCSMKECKHKSTVLCSIVSLLTVLSVKKGGRVGSVYPS